MKPPLRFGKFEVLQDADGEPVVLGSGAMGITYRARDTMLGREVALKVIGGTTEASQARARFIAEAKAVAQVEHPNIVMALEFGEEAGQYFYAMALARGKSLESIGPEGALPCQAALRVVCDLTSALAALHQAGFVHRDIKPANLVADFSGERPVTKLVDFGLAKDVHPDRTASAAGPPTGFSGTAHFCSPEQIEEADQKTDIRSDLYSVGATLWFLLTGKHVFEGSDGYAMWAHSFKEPPFERLTAPPSVMDLLRWTLQKDPARRPQSPMELLDRVDRAERAMPPEVRCTLVPAAANEGIFFSLHEVLRTRTALPIDDTVAILLAVAADVEGDWEKAGGRFNFQTQAVLARFTGPRLPAPEALFLTPVARWPEFSIVVPRPAAAPTEPGLGATIVEALPTSLTKTCVPPLARLAYELLGGNLAKLLEAGEPGRLAVLSEEGNAVLQAAFGDRHGMVYHSGADFCEALLEAPRRLDIGGVYAQGKRRRGLKGDDHSLFHRPRGLEKRHVMIGAATMLGLCGLLAMGRSRHAGPAPPAPEPTQVEETTITPISAATSTEPFVNGLEMSFVPVPVPGSPAPRILFATTETTVGQYAKFAGASAREIVKPTFPQENDHPAVNVTWEEATAFCSWLTNRERTAARLPPKARYRLPTDREWSCAVGLAGQESAGGSPSELGEKAPAVYPWGANFPPPARAGNYADESAGRAQNTALPAILSGVDDGFPQTAPVRAFPANAFGLYGLGGNVSEWCDDWFETDKQEMRVLRGGCWRDSDPTYLRSGFRAGFPPNDRLDGYGFRVVLEMPVEQ